MKHVLRNILCVLALAAALGAGAAARAEGNREKSSFLTRLATLGESEVAPRTNSTARSIIAFRACKEKSSIFTSPLPPRPTASEQSLSGWVRRIRALKNIGPPDPFSKFPGIIR